MLKALLGVTIVCLSAATAAAQGDADMDERVRRYQEAMESRARAEGRQAPDREAIERMIRARTESRRPASSSTRPSGPPPSRTRPSSSSAARSSKARGPASRFVVSVDQARFLERKRVVYRAKHVPASNLADIVNKVLVSEARIAAARDRNVSPVTIVPQRLTNSLIIGAPADIIDGVLDLVEDLDRRQQMVSIEILVAEVAIGTAEKPDRSVSVSDGSIGELAAKLQQRPGLRILARPRLAALEGQPTSLTLGGRVPRIIGSYGGRSSGQSNRISMEDMGLTLGMTTRVNPDGLVTMEIDLEKSHLGADKEGMVIAAAKEGEPVKTLPVRTLKTQTTVSVADGQTAILGGITAEGGPHPIELLLLVSPRIAK